jgi:hypothetical protein
MGNEIDFKELKRVYRRRPADKYLSKLKAFGSDFYVRVGSECTELIFDGRHKVYGSKQNNFPPSKIYLFNVVRIDVKRYLEKNPDIIVSPRKTATVYNVTYDDSVGTLTGTDLNHAFWRIAYIKNYISNKTYERGLDENCKGIKALRLSTLSILGREKWFDKYVNGVFVSKIITQELDPVLRSVYDDIRYSCYYMMYELSQMLGDDFDCWKTDCIYYRDTPENRKMVTSYFEEREMLYKQLIYSSSSPEEEPE